MPGLRLNAQSATNAAMILIMGSLGSKALGFAREMLTSYYFGASRAVDVFLVAGILPNIFSTMVASSLVTVLVPTLIALRAQKGDHEAWLKLASPIFLVIGLVMVVFSLFAFFGAAGIVSAFAPGFEPQAQAQAAAMTRTLCPVLFLAGVSGLLTGIFQSYRQFVVTAIAPLFLNAGVILALLVGARTLGSNALAYGYLLGAFLQFLALFIALVTQRPPFQWKQWRLTQEVKRVFLLWIPLLGASAAGQLDLLINRIVGSQLAAGSIAGLNYAYLIFQLFPSIIITSIGDAILPGLSQASAAKKTAAMETIFLRALRGTWAIVIPGSIFLIFFAFPLVQLVFQRGAFEIRDTWITATGLQYYALALVSTAFVSLSYRIFYAAKNTLLPLVATLASIATSVAFNLTLVRFMDHRGLALATALAALVDAILCLAFLRRLYSMRLRGACPALLWLAVSSSLAGTGLTLVDRFALSSLPLLLRFPLLLMLFSILCVLLNLLPRTPYAHELSILLKKIFSRRSARM
jgi:putative peptidoglycan lipid II flippase